MTEQYNQSCKLLYNHTTDIFCQFAYSLGAYEIFTFTVSGYNPIYPWYYNMHYGSYYDNYGPIDASLCVCPDCDSNFVLRYIEKCDISASYPIIGKSSRSNTRFNEGEVLHAFAIIGMCFFQLIMYISITFFIL